VLTVAAAGKSGRLAAAAIATAVFAAVTVRISSAVLSVTFTLTLSKNAVRAGDQGESRYNAEEYR
jgi:hypothetical protein